MHLKRSRIKFLVILVVLVLSALDHVGAFAKRTDDRSRYNGITAIVVNAIDGDTLGIDIPDHPADRTRIRLLGIDCPEIAHAPGESDAHFGREAADFVQEHMIDQKVRIALDPTRNPRDKFGRLLAYVYLEDSVEMLNETLLVEGLAYADPRFPHVFRHRFTELERRARRAKVGLWQDLNPQMMPPWR
ncbi:MAG: thermonuclease family protein [Planctomycetes bacterium]|nr:thermonuclease family protein [Planctomycetota bacterium]